MDKEEIEKALERERLIVIELILARNISWETTIREIMSQEKDVYNLFNETETHLFGIQLSKFGRSLELAIYNPKFEMVPDNEIIPRYNLETAREKFPFLFKEGG